MRKLYLLGAAAIFVFVMTLSPHVADAKTCKRAAGKFKSKVVAKWCKDHDQKWVKKQMKCFKKKVKARKDAPKNWGCKSCHKDLGGAYPTKANAAKDFKKWFRLLTPLGCQ